MRKMFVLVACAVALVAPAYAQAPTQDGGFNSGMDMLKLCEDTSRMVQTFCVTYLQGASDTVQVLMQTAGGTCHADTGKTGEQLRLEFLSMARGNPQHLHRSAAWFVLAISGCTMPTPQQKEGALLSRPPGPVQ